MFKRCYLLLFILYFPTVFAEAKYLPKTGSFDKPCVNTEVKPKLKPVRYHKILGGFYMAPTKTVDFKYGTIGRLYNTDTLSGISFFLNLRKDGGCKTYLEPYDYYSVEEIVADNKKGDLILSVAINGLRRISLNRFYNWFKKDVVQHLSKKCTVIKQDKKLYDLDVYTPIGPCLENKRRIYVYDRYLYTDSEGNPTHFIRCSRVTDRHKTPMCEAKFFYKDGVEYVDSRDFKDYPPLYFKISFRRKFLPYWREIENAVWQYFHSIIYPPSVVEETYK